MDAFAGVVIAFLDAMKIDGVHLAWFPTELPELTV
jgi:hypothetical protein